VAPGFFRPFNSVRAHAGGYIGRQVGTLESESDAHARIDLAHNQAREELGKAHPFTELVVARDNKRQPEIAEAASSPLCPARHEPQSVAACLSTAARRSCRAAMTTYPQKITFAELREMDVDEVLIYCLNRCGHHTELRADLWPDHVRLSDIEPKFICTGCGKRGAEVRPKFRQARMGNAG
jgi:hypothetical protein